MERRIIGGDRFPVEDNWTSNTDARGLLGPHTPSDHEVGPRNTPMRQATHALEVSDAENLSNG